MAASGLSDSKLVEGKSHSFIGGGVVNNITPIPYLKLMMIVFIIPPSTSKPPPKSPPPHTPLALNHDPGTVDEVMTCRDDWGGE